MATATLDELSDPVDRPPLLKVATASLVVAALLAIAGLAGDIGSPWVAGIFGTTTGEHVSVAGRTLRGLAMLSAVVPAVLVEQHRVARCALILAHVLISGAIYLCYLRYLGIGPAGTAVLTSHQLVTTIWMTAALSCGVLVFATVSGWTLTREPALAEPHSFSLRGMLIATAAAAVLFTSPRVVPSLVVLGVSWRWGSYAPDPDSVTVGNSHVVRAAVYGFLVTGALVSATLCCRSRRAAVGLILGSLLMPANASLQRC